MMICIDCGSLEGLFEFSDGLRCIDCGRKKVNERRLSAVKGLIGQGPNDEEFKTTNMEAHA